MVLLPLKSCWLSTGLFCDNGWSQPHSPSLCRPPGQAWPPAVPAVASSFPFSQGLLAWKMMGGFKRSHTAVWQLSLHVNVSTASSPWPLEMGFLSLGWPVHPGRPRACCKKVSHGNVTEFGVDKKACPNFLLSQSKKGNPSLNVQQLFYVYDIRLYRQSWDCFPRSEVQIYLFLFGDYSNGLQNVLELATQNAKASTQMLIGAGSFQLEQWLWLCSGVSPSLASAEEKFRAIHPPSSLLYAYSFSLRHLEVHSRISTNTGKSKVLSSNCRWLPVLEYQ